MTIGPAGGRTRWRAALLFATEVGGAAALDLLLKHLLLKHLFARPRPTLFPHLIPETNCSFPSGHAMGDLAFFLAVTLFLLDERKRCWKWLGLIGVVVALCIGASRPYLQVHYPSDIVAGWALSAAWVLLQHWLLQPRLERTKQRADPALLHDKRGEGRSRSPFSPLDAPAAAAVDF